MRKPDARFGAYPGETREAHALSPQIHNPSNTQSRHSSRPSAVSWGKLGCRPGVKAVQGTCKALARRAWAMNNLGAGACRGGSNRPSSRVKGVTLHGATLGAAR